MDMRELGIVLVFSLLLVAATPTPLSGGRHKKEATNRELSAQTREEEAVGTSTISPGLTSTEKPSPTTDSEPRNVKTASKTVPDAEDAVGTSTISAGISSTEKPSQTTDSVLRNIESASKTVLHPVAGHIPHTGGMSRSDTNADAVLSRIEERHDDSRSPNQIVAVQRQLASKLSAAKRNSVSDKSTGSRSSSREISRTGSNLPKPEDPATPVLDTIKKVLHISKRSISSPVMKMKRTEPYKLLSLLKDSFSPKIVSDSKGIFPSTHTNPQARLAEKSSKIKGSVSKLGRMSKFSGNQGLSFLESQQAKFPNKEGLESLRTKSNSALSKRNAPPSVIELNSNITIVSNLTTEAESRPYASGKNPPNTYDEEKFKGQMPPTSDHGTSIFDQTGEQPLPNDQLLREELVELTTKGAVPELGAIGRGFRSWYFV